VFRQRGLAAAQRADKRLMRRKAQPERAAKEAREQSDAGRLLLPGGQRPTKPAADRAEWLTAALNRSRLRNARSPTSALSIAVDEVSFLAIRRT
jgi:hypothetical protein